jgi:hypothetical protein
MKMQLSIYLEGIVKVWYEILSTKMETTQN